MPYPLGRGAGALRAVAAALLALAAVARVVHGQDPQQQQFALGLLNGDPTTCQVFLQQFGIAQLAAPAAAIPAATLIQNDPLARVQLWRNATFAGVRFIVSGNYHVPGARVGSQVRASVEQFEQELQATYPHCDATCQARQRQGLQALYAATNGPSWNNENMRRIWASDLHHCCWPGVTCCAAGHGMPSVVFDSNGAPTGVTDTRARLLGCIQEGGVTAVDLAGAARSPSTNSVQRPGGTIPAGVFSALRSSLEYFNARTLGITGALPADVLSAHFLRALHMEENAMSGDLPEAPGAGTDPLQPGWGGLPFLRQIVLRGNAFTGAVPETFGTAISLRDVLITGNRFSSTPLNMFLLPELRTFDANDNSLSTIYELGDQQAREAVANADAINGDPGIPTRVSARPTTLTVEDLGVRYTIGTGGIEALSFRNNAVSATVDGGLANALAAMSFLSFTKLDFGENLITGTIPYGLSLNARLKELYLDKNDFFGFLPDPVTKWNLEAFHLTGNTRMTGTFPLSVADVVTLRDLRFGGTNIFGPLPEAMGELAALQYLDLTDSLVTHDPQMRNSRGEPLPEFLRFGPDSDSRLVRTPVDTPLNVAIVPVSPRGRRLGGVVAALERRLQGGRRGLSDELTQNLICPQIQYAGQSQFTVTVVMDPLFHHFEGCECPEGFDYTMVDLAFAAALNARFGFAADAGAAQWPPAQQPNTPAADDWLRAHRPSKVPVCVRSEGSWATPVAIVLICIAAAVVLLLVVCAIVALVLRKQIAVSMLERRKRAGPPTAGREVTLVLTDVADSTGLWEEFPEDMAEANALHDAILRKHLSRWHGYEITTEGDSFLLAFHEPADAIGWCITVQQDLMTADWPSSVETRVAKSASQIKITAGRASRGEIDHAASGHSGSAAHAPELSAGGVTEEMAAEVVEDRAGPHLFRGLLVRMSMATGVAKSTSVHRVTRRVEYRGECMSMVNDIQEMTHGGQILACERTMEVVTRGPLKQLGAQIAALKPAKALLSYLEGLTQARGPRVHWGKSSNGVQSSAGRRPSHGGDGLVDGPVGSHVSATASSRKTSFDRGTRPSLGGVGREMSTASLALEDSGAFNDSTRAFMGNGRVPPQQKPSRVESDLMVVDMGEIVPEGGTGAADTIHVYQLLVPHLEERARFLPPPQGRAVGAGYFDAPGAAAPILPHMSRCQHHDVYSKCPQCKRFTKQLPDVVIVFCAPCKISELSSEAPSATRHAVRIYKAAVRRSLQEFGGYECQELDATFMLAFYDMRSAMMWSIALQEVLPKLPWPSRLLETSHARQRFMPGGGMIPGGLRVRIGIHEGRPLRVVPHTATGRADYFGPLVNRAARMCFAAAQPGQVVADIAQIVAGISAMVGNGGKGGTGEVRGALSANGLLSARAFSSLDGPAAPFEIDPVRVEGVDLVADDEVARLCGDGPLNVLRGVPRKLNLHALDELDKGEGRDVLGELRQPPSSVHSRGARNSRISGGSGAGSARGVQFLTAGDSGIRPMTLESKHEGGQWVFAPTRATIKLDHIGRYRLKGVQGEFELGCLRVSEMAPPEGAVGRKGTLLAPPAGLMLSVDVTMPMPLHVGRVVGSALHRGSMSSVSTQHAVGPKQQRVRLSTYGARNGHSNYQDT
ncbi:unnamed protein product [Pedinophyceae sp. YPF-701]|nr:unnamed protein product [Pedinophyceae sp. YPF-701]